MRGNRPRARLNATKWPAVPRKGTRHRPARGAAGATPDPLFLLFPEVVPEGHGESPSKLIIRPVFGKWLLKLRCRDPEGLGGGGEIFEQCVLKNVKKISKQ